MKRENVASSFVLHADQEHAGLRVVVLGMVVLGVIVGYTGVNWALTRFASPEVQDYTVFLSCVGGAPLGLAIAWVGERILKRVWPSGNQVVLHSGETAVIEAAWQTDAAAKTEQNFEPARGDTLFWYFSLSGYPRGGSERRAPKRFYCMAAQVQEDEDRLIVYAFVSPRKTEELIEIMGTNEEGAGFHEIEPKDVYDRKLLSFRAPARPQIPAEVIRGPDGHYWLAERRRWQDGLELTAGDFETFIQFMRKHGEW